MKNTHFFPWKYALLALSAGFFLPGRAGAQCTNNLFTRTYDTAITGPGYGTYHFNFPKWSSDSGLLVSVKISAVVNLQYGFSLKNVDTLAGSYGLRVGREDYFTSSALAAAYDNINEQAIGTYLLDPGVSTSMSPFPFLHNYANVDSITGNTAPFLGSGMVSFTYSPITYTNIHTANNASYSYHAMVTDLTHFSVSYLYCKGADVVLASGLSSFTAGLEGPGSVRLDWVVNGDDKGRVYEVQRGRDSVSFESIGSAVAGTSAASYQYMDRLPGDAAGGPGAGGGPAGSGVSAGAGNVGTGANASGKWYYRLRIIEPVGIAWSPIRSVATVAMGSGKLLIYPNPAVDHINLLVPGDPAISGAGGAAGMGAALPGDWHVEIRAVDGSLIQAANFFHSNNLPIFFHHNLSSGVYFVRVSGLSGHDSHVASFRADKNYP